MYVIIFNVHKNELNEANENMFGGLLLYKLVALDVDGTLLNEDRKITDKVKFSIQKAKEKGIKIIIVSGRGFRGVESLVRELGLEDLVVSLNGAAVTDSTGETLVFSEHLDSKICSNILKLSEEMNISTLLFVDKDVYAEKYDYAAEIFEENDRVKVNCIHRKLSEFYRDQPAGKLLMIGEHERLNDFKEMVWKKYGNKINVTFSMPHFLEVYSPNINKGVVLNKVAEYYGIKRDEIIAIGDGENDIPMIEYAGLGVAMGNANDKVKEKASFITKTNSEDGVAYVLEKYILNKT